jgi:glycosyltransferase involved in cell wall biosynthesis
MNSTTYLEHATSSRKQLFSKGLSVLFAGNTLTMKEKLKLFKLCYTHDSQGVGVKWFLNCITAIKIIQEKNIHHIHCHFASKNVHLAYLIHQTTQIPYTFTAHAYEIFPQSDKRTAIWAQNAKKVIAPSKFNKQYMHDNLQIPLKNIEVVTCSKYLDKLQSVREYSLFPFHIISVSRLVEKKGYPYLIEACSILKKRGIEFSCTIQGEGDQRKILTNLIREQDLEKEVALGEALTHEELLAFIRTGSVFVLPCIRAGDGDLDVIPNVLMESMAMGIPTISTEISGIPELIEDGVNGVLVPTNDSLALAEAIIKVRNNPDFAEAIRKKGREKVEQDFDVRKNIEKLAAIFQTRNCDVKSHRRVF